MCIIFLHVMSHNKEPDILKKNENLFHLKKYYVQQYGKIIKYHTLKNIWVKVAYVNT